MTGQILHVFTNPVPDGTITSIVRPSDWNSVHAFVLQDGVLLGGNTAGVMADISSGTFVIAGGNNVTLSQNANSVTISGPHTSQFLTTAALSNHSHGNPQLNLTNLSGTTASNSAGFTLSLSGGDLANFLTTAALSNHSHGNPTLNLTNLSGTTASNSAGFTLSLSAGAGGAGDGGNILAAGTRTAGSNSSVLFSNLNGLTFGLDAVNGSVMTAIYTVPTLTNSTLSISDAATSGTLARLAFTNLNGVTLSLSSGAGGSHTIVGSHNALTSQSNQNVTANNGGFAFQTLSFSNAQGVSFATSAGNAIVGSVETSYAASNHSHGNPTLALTNLSGTTASASNGFTLSLSAGAGGAGDGGNILAAGTRSAGSNSSVLFSNLNGLTFGLDAVNGSVMTASYTVPIVTNSSMSISDAATSGTIARLAFTNLNGITLSLSSGAGGSHTIVGSYTVPSVTNSSWSVSDAATSGTVGRLAFTNLNGITLSLSSGTGGLHTIVGSHNALTSQSNQNVTAGNGGFAFQTLSFSNAQGVSFATSAGSAIVASVETSYAASNHSHGNPTLALTNLSGTTASASNGLTLSLSANPIFIRSRFNPFMEAVAVATVFGQATLHIHPIPDPEAFQFNRMLFDVQGIQSTASNSSGSFTVSMWAGLYTRNASTLSLLASSSSSLGLSISGTVRSTLNNGGRLMSIGWTTTILQNDLWLGILSRTTSAGANLYTLSQYAASDINSNFSGFLGAVPNASDQNVLGLGIYSVTTSGIPAAIAFTEIRGTASEVLRVPMYYFLSNTA